MSYGSQVSAAFGEAQGILAQMQGASSNAKTLIGPDGESYSAVFRPADAIDAQSVDREMTGHGYNEHSVMVATLTRDQFDAAPTDWKRKQATRIVPAPARVFTVSSVSTDDPVHYVLILVSKQGG
jgi:hypothetical protein